MNGQKELVMMSKKTIKDDFLLPIGSKMENKGWWCWPQQPIHE